MVKIVRGTYGYFNGHSVDPKTSKDDPFELTPEQEKRLVDKGVAVYVDAEPQAEPAQVEKTEAEKPGELQQEAEAQENETVTVEDLEKLKLSELKERATEYGVEYKVGMKKAELAKLVFEASQLEAEDDGEELPDADPAAAIV